MILLSEMLLNSVKDKPQRFGTEVLTTRPSGTRKITDVHGLTEWLGTPAAIRMAFNLTGQDARIKVIRGIAIDRKQSPQAIEDTFFARPDGERVLSRLPVDGANTPKWAKNLREEE